MELVCVERTLLSAALDLGIDHDIQIQNQDQKQRTRVSAPLTNIVTVPARRDMSANLADAAATPLDSV
jgi:hypothetical protein